LDILQFLPSFGNFAYTLAAFIVAISIIVAVHEYGHYIVGRWCGIHAEVFSLGFGPVLFARNDRHGTKWQIAAIPFGGYVKFLGDANAASVGAVSVSAADRRRTMLGAPLWARAATVAAGPVFNFVFSFLLFAAILVSEGQARDPLTIETIIDLPPSTVVELQPGDQILAIDGNPILEGAFSDEITVQPSVDYTILRDGVEQVVAGPYPYPAMIGGLTPNSAAIEAGLQSGDIVTAINGEPSYAFDQLFDAVMNSDGQTLVLDIWRRGEKLRIEVTPRRADLPLPEGGFETRWLIGAIGDVAFTIETERMPVLPALGLGISQVGYVISNSLSGLYHIVTGAISTCNLSGPVGIAETSGAMASQGTVNFLWFIAVISTAIGLMNLFPIPVLDGGHLVFHAYEAVTGRTPGDSALRILMATGLAVVLTLMLFALANDLFLCP
jgi:regulator of sigma E protease